MPYWYLIWTKIKKKCSRVQIPSFVRVQAKFEFGSWCDLHVYGGPTPPGHADALVDSIDALDLGDKTQNPNARPLGKQPHPGPQTIAHPAATPQKPSCSRNPPTFQPSRCTTHQTAREPGDRPQIRRIRSGLR